MKSTKEECKPYEKITEYRVRMGGKELLRVSLFITSQSPKYHTAAHSLPLQWDWGEDRNGKSKKTCDFPTTQKISLYTTLLCSQT